MKYRLTILLALIVAQAFQPVRADRNVRPTKPNILFIAVDDLKPMLGCYGDKKIKTPNIDRLAERGTVFLNNYCNYAVCGPSRASLMSSMMPEETGVIGFLPMRAQVPDLVTLPQHFKNNGYETAATGKLNDFRCVGEIVAPDKPTKGGKKTDDIPSWSIPYRTIKGESYSTKGKPAFDAPDNEVSEHRDYLVGLEGIKLLRELKEGGKPFFLGVGFYKPHLPFIAPRKYWDMYDRDAFKIHPFQQRSKNAVEYTWHDSEYELRGYDGIPKKGPIPEELQIDLIHGYHACVTMIDDLVGDLLAELDELDLREDTIVVLWGDHGFHLGDHAMWGKHTNLEQAMGAPLIVSSPVGKQENGSTESVSSFIDIYPTLCELAGLPIPGQVRGTSLVPILQNPAASVQDGVVGLFRAHGVHYGYAYRTPRYRYIEWVHSWQDSEPKIEGRELYDYETDPMETVNLAADERYAGLVEKFAKALREKGAGCTRLQAVK